MAEPSILTPHTQTPVKVNAWVDEGIAPLVEALNEHPDVETTESCEGRNGKRAYVYFRHRVESDLHAERTVALGISLAALLRPLARNADFFLAVEWSTGCWLPRLRLEVFDGCVPALACSLRKALRS